MQNLMFSHLCSCIFKSSMILSRKYQSTRRNVPTGLNFKFLIISCCKIFNSNRREPA